MFECVLDDNDAEYDDGDKCWCESVLVVLLQYRRMMQFNVQCTSK